MVIYKYFIVFTLISLFAVHGNSQALECTLDIGGENSGPVAQIFQLNEAQKVQVEELRAKYSITYKGIDDEMQKLLAEHPQSTPEELLTMAEKYKALQVKLVVASREIDKNLLSTFNQKQYDLYLSLCHEAFRRPIEVTPVIYDGPTGEKK